MFVCCHDSKIKWPTFDALTKLQHFSLNQKLDLKFKDYIDAWKENVSVNQDQWFTQSGEAVWGFYEFLISPANAY